MSRATEDDGDPRDTAGVFIGPDWPIVSAVIEGIDLKIQLKPRIVENPLFKGHNGHGVGELLAEARVNVPSFFPTDHENYQSLLQRLDRVLLETSNRLVDYFRYRLGNPLLKRLNYGSKGPWTFFDGAEAKLHEEGEYTMVGQFPGLPGTKLALGSTSLKPEDLAGLNDFVAHPMTASTTLKLQTQARDAVLANDINLGVILLAVCSEVAIKTAYFRRDPVVGEAYDYLEEKRQVEVTAIELITQVAKRAFGQAFKDSEPLASQRIEYLFRCRNKVAHRGQASFRDQAGVIQIPDENTLLEWWEAVDRLLRWLAVLTAAKQS